MGLWKAIVRVKKENHIGKKITVIKRWLVVSKKSAKKYCSLITMK